MAGATIPRFCEIGSNVVCHGVEPESKVRILNVIHGNDEPEPKTMNVKKLLPVAKVPSRATDGAAGYDLFSAESGELRAGQSKIFNTAIAVEIPRGYYGRVASKSGLAANFGIDVGGGVIDCDYRGSIGVILFKHSRSAQDDSIFIVNVGDKIAQLIIEKIATPEIVVVEELSDTRRGSAGFGSTGR